MHIDEILNFTIPSAKSEHTIEYHDLIISKDWTQGRTVFGGISAAMLFTAINNIVDDKRVLRSFTTNFIGPLTPDKPFSIFVKCLRKGRNVSQYTAEIIQNDNVCVFSQACFGVGRKSKVTVENTSAHTMAPPTKAKYIPQIPKITPKFIQHVDLAIEDGGLPFTGKKSAFYKGYMRFTKAPSKIVDAHLIALIDAWPPTLLQLLRWPAPASTVSWHLEFIHPHREISGENWFAYQANTIQAADGYGHVEATIWDKHNKVIALSRQTLAVFD